MCEASIPPAARSPNFAAWFAGSKVVDQHGEPLVVYHGTIKAGIPEFFPMTHFGSSEAASARLQYLHQLQHGDDYDIYAPFSQIVPVYLSIKKPVHLTDDGQPHTPKVVAELLAARWDFYQQVDMEEYELDELLRGMARKRSFGPLIRFLSRLGYDGMEYTNLVEDRDSVSWVVFNKHQAWPILSSQPL